MRLASNMAFFLAAVSAILSATTVAGLFLLANLGAILVVKTD